MKKSIALVALLQAGLVFSPTAFSSLAFAEGVNPAPNAQAAVVPGAAQAAKSDTTQSDKKDADGECKDCKGKHGKKSCKTCKTCKMHHHHKDAPDSGKKEE